MQLKLVYIWGNSITNSNTTRIKMGLVLRKDKIFKNLNSIISTFLSSIVIFSLWLGFPSSALEQCNLLIN